MNRLDTTYILPALVTGNAALLATPWFDCGSLYSFGMAFHTPGTGSPVGTFSFQGSNDRTAVELIRNLGTAPNLTDAAKKFTILTPTTVHGSALAITGSSPSDSFVIFADLPRYLRLIYTFTSGGSAASIATVLTCGRE